MKLPPFWLFGSVWLLGLDVSQAGAKPAAFIPPELACGIAGRAAEQAAALPKNLLNSIGFVESGRRDPVSGRVSAWPWTVNLDGAGYYFASEQQAVQFTQAAQDSARDLDVGCFQISLQQHPTAFASLNAAFDPAANADVAAHFLNDLKTQTGSWQAATADYHSAMPALGLPYQQHVWTAWQQLGGAPESTTADFLEPVDASVILEAPTARLVRVITADTTTSPAWTYPASPWLPRVITP